MVLVEVRDWQFMIRRRYSDKTSSAKKQMMLASTLSESINLKIKDLYLLLFIGCKVQLRVRCMHIVRSGVACKHSAVTTAIVFLTVLMS